MKLDIERIGRDNKNKPGLRKMGFLVNEGDKLTKELRAEKQREA